MKYKILMLLLFGFW